MNQSLVKNLIKKAEEAYKKGDYIKEKKAYQKLYDLYKSEVGENHSNTLTALHNLAITYSNLGDYNKACELYNIVYNARKEILGENHSDTLSALNNLAGSYAYLGDYSKAFKLQSIVYNARKKSQEKTILIH